jgi:hypothetical protein
VERPEIWLPGHHQPRAPLAGQWLPTPPALRTDNASLFVFVFFPLSIGLHMQYFIPSAKKGINRQIELAILRADKMGVKVISLAALNKVDVQHHYPLSIYVLLISEL